jgi:general stress protein YciG
MGTAAIQQRFATRHSSDGREDMATNRSGRSKRGFAAMDPAKQREIASKGGKASHGGGRKSSSSR